MSFGKTNKEVKELQELLNFNGFNGCNKGPNSPGQETGSFDLCTEKSIKLFQQYNNLKVTGTVDTQTTVKLNEFIKELKESGNIDEKGAQQYYDEDQNTDENEQLERIDNLLNTVVGSVISQNRTTVSSSAESITEESLKDDVEGEPSLSKKGGVPNMLKNFFQTFFNRHLINDGSKDAQKEKYSSFYNNFSKSIFGN